MSRRALAILAALALAACARAPQPVRFFADGQPRALSEWRVVVVRDGRLVLNAGVLPYDLNTPLFTDYAHKLRTVWMPAGSAARYDEADFDYPVGTILSKTFYYPLPAQGGDSVVLRSADHGPRSRDGGLDLSRVRLVETRLLVRREQGWVALPYVWNAEQTDAVLQRGGALVSLTLAGVDGRTQALDYAVPDQNQCAGCHADDMATRALRPLGPRARHLNRDFDYPDGRSSQLAHWASIGYLEGAPRPEEAPRNADWDDPGQPLEARARAYLDINCGHCHSPDGPGNTSGLWLDAATREPLRLGRCKLPIAAGQGTGDHRHDIVPGRPEASILVHRMASTDPAAMMPELGRSVAHDEGVQLVRDWIAAMQGGCDGAREPAADAPRGAIAPM